MTTGSVFSVQQKDEIAKIVRKELVPTNGQICSLKGNLDRVEEDVDTLKEDVKEIREELKEIRKEMLTKDEFYTAMDRYAERLEAASQEAKMNFGISMRHEEAIEKLKAILVRDGIDIQKIKLHLHLQ